MNNHFPMNNQSPKRLLPTIALVLAAAASTLLTLAFGYWLIANFWAVKAAGQVMIAYVTLGISTIGLVLPLWLNSYRRVFHAGNVHLHQKLHELQKIRFTTVYARSAYFGPRVGFALFTTTIFLLGLMIMQSKLGFHFAVVPFAGAAFWMAALSLTKLPSSYVELLNQQLLKYRPFDTDAYKVLQQDTKDCGHIDVDLIWVWAEMEESAIQKELGVIKPVGPRFWLEEFDDRQNAS